MEYARRCTALLGLYTFSRRLTVAVTLLKRLLFEYWFCISEISKFQFQTFVKRKVEDRIVRFRNLVWRRDMNVFSQSASRAEADSGDDSELSLSLLQKVQNEPFSFDLT